MRALRLRTLFVLPAIAIAGLPVLAAAPVGAVEVGTAGDFVDAFEDGSVTEISLTASLTLPPEPTRPLGAEPLLIEGNGFSLTGAEGSRVLSAFNPVGGLTVRDITITGGTPDGGQGAGIAWGGPVTVEDSTLTGNHAYLNGGGVYAIGSATITRSSITANSASTDGAAIFVQADDDEEPESGTISIVDSNITGHTDEVLDDGPSSTVETTGAITVLRSVISDNMGDGAVSDVGPIDVTDSTTSGNGGDGVVADGPITVVSSTLHGNAGFGARTESDLTLLHATVTGNDVGVFAADEVLITASALGENPEANCVYGEVTTVSGGANVVDDTSCELDDATDLAEEGLALGLGALSDNGGTTLTRLPGAASPVLDVRASADCADAPVDQRGVDRPQGPGCDAGSVERTLADPVAPTPTPTPGSTPAPTTPGGAAAPAVAARANPAFTG